MYVARAEMVWGKGWRGGVLEGDGIGRGAFCTNRGLGCVFFLLHWRLGVVL